MKKLSIITINYNNAEGLRKTIDSVLKQTCREFDYIIIDGASTDESVGIIRASALQAEDLAFTWKSEPDSGIYNAMNKGLKMTLGEYVLMLNSGDYLVDEHVIEQILPELDGTDIIQGNVVTKKIGRECVERGYGHSDISFIEAMGGRFLHQASFCRRDLFERYGYFDESYRINGDTVFYAKCLAFGNATFKYVDKNIAFYDIEGISAETNDKWSKIRKEEDLRYAQMYSKRMWRMQLVESQKILLYDTLRAHRWAWNIAMVLVRMCNFFDKKK